MTISNDPQLFATNKIQSIKAYGRLKIVLAISDLFQAVSGLIDLRICRLMAKCTNTRSVSIRYKLYRITENLCRISESRFKVFPVVIYYALSEYLFGDPSKENLLHHAKLSTEYYWVYITGSMLVFSQGSRLHIRTRCIVFLL